MPPHQTETWWTALAWTCLTSPWTEKYTSREFMHVFCCSEEKNTLRDLHTCTTLLCACILMCLHVSTYACAYSLVYVCMHVFANAVFCLVTWAFCDFFFPLQDACDLHHVSQLWVCVCVCVCVCVRACARVYRHVFDTRHIHTRIGSMYTSGTVS